ncbi:TetR/AcrR family transcriptional regulator [Terriglobus tenax]|uniref:TetR/AcrR family transcriptional regulator n=1 Tax=Terriglobus tenax TaxID=1111115 RepID=UPI0021E0F92D|nr:TetR/AcrR family transcriptional regulator [Terriglobus tenax]
MSKRDSILKSAETLIRNEGSQQLTLDRVAEKAKVSKGGLLYHFPSKEELVAGLVARTIEYFDRDVDAAKATLPEGPGRNTQAFLLASLEGRWAADAGLSPDRLDIFASALAAASTDMKLMEPMRQAYARWQAVLDNDGLDPITATIVRLAVDGLWYTELFRLDDNVCTGERREQIMERLKRMCVPEDSTPAAKRGKQARKKR